MKQDENQMMEKSKKEARVLQLHSPFFFFKIIWILAILLIILYRFVA